MTSDMKGKYFDFIVDKLAICYTATDEVATQIKAMTNEIFDCFRLVALPDNTSEIYTSSAAIMGDIPGEGERRVAVLNWGNKLLRNNENAKNYFWLYVENWLLYFQLYKKINSIGILDYITDTLHLEFKHLTGLDVAVDSNVNFAQRVKKLIFDKKTTVILNNRVRSDKKEVLDEILYVQTGDQVRFRSLTIYVKQKKPGLTLKLYDKTHEIESSRKEYIRAWHDAKKRIYRAEVSLNREVLKDSKILADIPNERLLTELAGNQQLLCDLFLEYSNRLLRFRIDEIDVAMSILETGVDTFDELRTY